MNIFGLVFAVFALLAVLNVANSQTIAKPTSRKPSNKLTTRKPVSTFRPKPAQTIADCTELKYCTNFIQPVWATDTEKQTCVLFRNKCHFLNNNCMLLLENKKALQETTQQLCKPLCRECDSDFNFVCGELNNAQRRMFLSECDMKNYACKTGEPYMAQPDLSLCNAQVIQNYLYNEE